MCHEPSMKMFLEPSLLRLFVVCASMASWMDTRLDDMARVVNDDERKWRDRLGADEVPRTLSDGNCDVVVV